MASYGAVELKEVGDDEDEDAGFSHSADTFTPRALAIYQAGLCVLFIVVGCWWVSTYELFQITDSNTLLTPSDGVASVETFAAAFEVPKGAKKGTDPSDPDMVFLLTPSIKEWFGGHKGSWVWSHGDLYLMLPTAMLHAVSAGLMDPTMSTTKPPTDSLSAECFISQGDRVDCLKSLMLSQLDENHPPKGGYFAFVTDNHMEIFHYSTEFGIVFTPVHMEDIWHWTLVFVTSLILTAVVMATAMAGGAVYTVVHLHQDHLDEYIDKGSFMHDEEHHNMYEDVLHQIHDEHHDEHADAAEHDPEHEPDMHDDHPAIAKAQKKAKKRLKAQIYENQGVLHLVSSIAKGGKSSKMAEHPDLDSVSGPTIFSQIMIRTTETIAHALLMVLTCSPVLIANYFFKQGLTQFGRFGLNSGMLPYGAVAYYFHTFMLFSTLICVILLLSLIFHYISHEFNGEQLPICKILMQNPISQFMFKSWTGFSYLQAAMLWMSSIMISIFILSGAMGLVLHLFTNMFMVTSLIGVGATAYVQFTFFAEIVKEVHGEIHHANVIMDDLVEALSKRLMHLRLKPHDENEPAEKTRKRKKKVHEMQKAILLVRSGFSNCVKHELHEHGFGPKEFLINIGAGLAGAAVIIAIVFSAMKSAHLFGKAVDAAASALAGGAMVVMNSSKKPEKKGPPKFPPSVALAIEDLNIALQLVVHDSVADLVLMLRHESHCIDLITGAITTAEQEMSKEDGSDAWAKKNALAFIKTARDGLKTGIKNAKLHNAKKAEEKAAKKALAASAPVQHVPKVTATAPQASVDLTSVGARKVSAVSPAAAASPKTAVELARQGIGDQTWVCKMDTKSHKVYYFTIKHKKPQWTAPEGWDTPIKLPEGATHSPPRAGAKTPVITPAREQH